MGLVKGLVVENFRSLRSLELSELGASLKPALASEFAKGEVAAGPFLAELARWIDGEVPIALTI